MPTISKDQIDTIFADAEHQQDYVLALYASAYGEDWPRVKLVKEWPLISSDTNDYIFKQAMKFDAKHHPDVFRGGAWMNNGFNGSDEVTEFGEVRLRETEWISAE